MSQALRDLEPKFLKRETSREFRNVDTLAEADGLWLLCPVCFKTNGGRSGTHGVICWDPSVPQDTDPTPGRWKMEGTNFDDLTLVAGSSSILLDSQCKAHFFIRNGKIEF